MKNAPEAALELARNVEKERYVVATIAPNATVSMSIVQSPESWDVSESRASRFARLATARTNKSLKAISLLKNLSNTALYEFTPEQVKIIVDSLQAELNEVQEAFQPKEQSVPRAVNLISSGDVSHVLV